MATNQITALIDQHLEEKDYEEMERHERLVRQFLDWDLDDDEMDVLGELELIVQAAGIEKEADEGVPLGEIAAGVSALERSIATDMSTGAIDSFDY